MREYGIGFDEYKKRLESQDSLCQISGLLLAGKAAHLDHDHKTGTLRNFLHRDINVALGLFQDNPEWLRRAADYIEFWRVNDTGGVKELAAKA